MIDLPALHDKGPFYSIVFEGDTKRYLMNYRCFLLYIEHTLPRVNNGWRQRLPNI